MEKELKLTLAKLIDEIKKVNKNVLLLSYMIFQDIPTESQEESELKSNKLKEFEKNLNIKSINPKLINYLG